ncbi:MAG: GspE/PulE family protein [bacterium]|nr:GspE/PulE family protein [bacterium]
MAEGDNTTGNTQATVAAKAPAAAPVAAPAAKPAPPATSKPTLAVTDTAAASANIDNVNRDFQEQSTSKKAESLGIPYIDIGKTPLNPDFLRLLDYEIAKKARVIPFFKVGKNLRVAVEDPDSAEAKSALKLLTDKEYVLTLNLSSNAGIDDALKVFREAEKFQKVEIVEEVAEESIGTHEEEIAKIKGLGAQLEPVTAEEALNMINVAAIKTGVSDIHYEPEPTKVVVRFRIDGMLHKAFEMKTEVYNRLINQIKYTSKLQLNVTSIPQDGRYSFKFNQKSIGVRVSSIPTPAGESFVCRLLISEETPLTLTDLGFQGLALKNLERACKISHGMILSTGPTGSGKTTTLYSILSTMNTPENKTITLEDPVEYSIAGVTQSQIDEKRQYTFSGGLRAILRQDPDIVMLGEIRDKETAEIAAQAALTGHVLLSTLHTNSALETIPRMINMGLPAFMVAPAIDTIIAQRLVRKVCPKCSTKVPIKDSEKKEFEEIMENLKKVNPNAVIEIPTEVPKVASCDTCSNTGYKGRAVLAEVITLDSELKDLIMNNASMVNLIMAARRMGMVTMREDGYMKVAQGMTTLDEVYRVTSVSN